MYGSSLPEVIGVLPVTLADGTEVEVSTIRVGNRYETVVFCDREQFYGCFDNPDVSYSASCGPAIADEIVGKTLADLRSARYERFSR